MCGIAVSVGGKDTTVNRLNVVRMLHDMVSRGDCLPSMESCGSGALGCVRLAIVDENHGAQPMFNDTHDIGVVFNGEIYNWTALRTELEAKGRRFRTACDTEVLVHGFEEWGKELPKHLDGMFAFVIIDSRRGRVFASRDSFGIKPLYKGLVGDHQGFASEIRSLVRLGARGIVEIPPGGYVENGHASDRVCFPADIPICSLPFNEAKTHLRRLLRDSVRGMLNTDLPVAVLLSGGIDSSAVLYEAAQVCQSLTAFAVGVSPEASDVQAAQRVAAKLKVRFKPVIVSPEELLRSIPRVIDVIESFEPNHIRGGTLSYALAQAVHQEGIKVALCGEGADELLAGYPEFIACTDATDVESRLREMIDRFARELHRTQLRRVDRSNMAFSVEVRVPFLDDAVARFALSLPWNYKLRVGDGAPGVTTKWILREAYRRALPDEVVDRPKVVLSEGAGMGDNSDCGPFFDYGKNFITDEDFAYLRRRYPQFELRTKEEALYFCLFEARFGALSLATHRPQVNRLPTRG